MYPQRGAHLDRDVIEGLTNLRTQRLIRSAATRYPHRPLLRVAFCNFWPRFDRRDNYFVWMLAHRFDVILVDPRADIPDVVFYSTHPAAEFDHLRLDRSRTRKILVARGGGLARWSECDFLFTTGAVRSAPADRYQQLPLWSLYVDWDAYEASDTGLGDALPARLRPLAMSNRLYDLLQSRPPSARAASSLPPEVVPQRVAMRSRTAAEPTAAGASSPSAWRPTTTMTASILPFRRSASTIPRSRPRSRSSSSTTIPTAGAPALQALAARRGLPLRARSRDPGTAVEDGCFAKRRHHTSCAWIPRVLRLRRDPPALDYLEASPDRGTSSRGRWSPTTCQDRDAFRSGLARRNVRRLGE